MTADELDRADITGLRATLREDEADTQLSREKGLDLVNELFMATRTFTIHASDNEATNYSIERVVETIRRLIEALGTAQFIIAEGEAYINDVRIRVEARNYGNLQYVTQLLDTHALGGITLSRTLTPDQVRAMVIALIGRPEGEDPIAELREKMAESDIPVGLEPPFVQATEDMIVSGTPAESEGTAGYAQGIAAFKDYADVVVSEGFANPLKVRRAVQDMIDLSADDVELPLKLQAIQGAEDAFFNHSVNVANLSIAIGKDLGLSKIHLRELGVAAVFHDVGYAYLDAPEDDDPEYERKREENKQLHAVTGVMLLGNEKGYQPHKARRMRVALEHHMHYRRPGGFPPMFTDQLGVFTRIVQVADHYDAMVAPDPKTGETRYLPAQALRKILQGGGTRFDPTVVKAFVRVMGRHPFGSLVRLNTREWGIVMGAGRPGEGFKRPPVRLIRDRDGNPTEGTIDLLDPAQQDRWIIKALDPVVENIDIKEYLFGEHSAIGDLMHGAEPPPLAPSTNDDDEELRETESLDGAVPGLDRSTDGESSGSDGYEVAIVESGDDEDSLDSEDSDDDIVFEIEY
jgi:HD-GYP domain-containing protein (c-di-GMP phosphodiesterase class II)